MRLYLNQHSSVSLVWIHTCKSWWSNRTKKRTRARLYLNGSGFVCYSVSHPNQTNRTELFKSAHSNETLLNLGLQNNSSSFRFCLFYWTFNFTGQQLCHIFWIFQRPAAITNRSTTKETENLHGKITICIIVINELHTSTYSYLGSWSESICKL